MGSIRHKMNGNFGACFILILFAFGVVKLIGDNRRTFSRRISIKDFGDAVLSTCGFGLAFLLFLSPALVVKGVVDHHLTKLITGIEEFEGVSVPQEYPFWSMERLLGMERPPITIDLPPGLENIKTALPITRTLLNWIGLVGYLLVFVVYSRALLSIFARQLVSRGLGVCFYVPGDKPSEDSSAISNAGCASGTISDRLSLSSKAGRFVYLKRSLSPSGGTPWVEAPQPTTAVFSRWLAGCFLMNKYQLSASPLSLTASEGHRFACMEICAGKEIVFNYRYLIGWSDQIVFSSGFSFQFGGVAQGEWSVQSAKGPGYLLFDVSGMTEFRDSRDSPTFEIDRLIAFDKLAIFEANANSGFLNTLLGAVTIKSTCGGSLLLDPQKKAKSSSHPILAMIKFVYGIR